MNARIAYWLLCATLIIVLVGCSNGTKTEKGTKNILLLTGQNNHEWRETTNALVKMYKKLPDYKVTVTEDPDTLTFENINDYDVLVSNWNNWPDNSGQYGLAVPTWAVNPSSKNVFTRLLVMSMIWSGMTRSPG